MFPTERSKLPKETEMKAAAIFVAIFAAVFVAIVLALLTSGERFREAQERARRRRLAEARMDARLLRLNL